MLKIALSVILVVCDIALIAIVMLQSGKSAGLSGAIAGGADTFLSKNKAKSLDAKLAKLTKWVAIAFMVLARTVFLTFPLLLAPVADVPVAAGGAAPAATPLLPVVVAQQDGHRDADHRQRQQDRGDVVDHDRSPSAAAKAASSFGFHSPQG